MVAVWRGGGAAAAAALQQEKRVDGGALRGATEGSGDRNGELGAEKLKSKPVVSSGLVARASAGVGVGVAGLGG